MAKKLQFDHYVNVYFGFFQSTKISIRTVNMQYKVRLVEKHLFTTFAVNLFSFLSIFLESRTFAGGSNHVDVENTTLILICSFSCAHDNADLGSSFCRSLEIYDSLGLLIYLFLTQQ